MELKLALLGVFLAASVTDRVISALVWTAVGALLLRWLAIRVEQCRDLILRRRQPHRR